MIGRGGRYLLGAVAMLLVAPASALNTPNQFCIGDPCIIGSDRDADPNIVLDFGTRTVELRAQLNMLPLPSSGPGSLTIKCGTFRIATNGYIKGSAATAPGGIVVIEAANAIQLNGNTTLGDVRLTGQDGGSLTLRTTMGGVSGSGRLNLGADGLIASGGNLTIQSGSDINLSGTLSGPGGTQGAGATFDLQAPGSITLSGLVDLTGGQGGGGFMDVTALGSISVSNVDLSGSSEFGDAGLATFDAGASVTIGALAGRGANDGENCGDAADIDVFAGADISLNGTIDIRGRGLDCSGGFLSMDGNRVFLNGPLLMSGEGTEGEGGDLDISALSLIQVASSGSVDLSAGSGGAGDLLMLSEGDITVAGRLDVYGRSTSSPGSTLVELNARGTLTLSNVINANGGASVIGGGGDVSLLGCKVDTATTTQVTATGDVGAIRVEAHDKLTLRGSFQAGTGGVSVQYGPRAVPPTVTASFSPPTAAVLNPLLLPCRLCDTNAECNDGNQCTTDTCPADGSACINAQHTGACTDNNACTVGDSCVAGACVPGAAPNCNDASSCTIDSCLPTTGCIHFPLPGSCDDGNACTSGDSCDIFGVCRGTAANCDDGNPCTDDSCSGGGCTHVNNTLPCTDNNACTTGDACSGGSCSGSPRSCDDSNGCTTDSCAPASGCQNVAQPGCADTDSDGKQDNVDECTTIAWTSPPTTPPDQFPKTFGLTTTKLSAPDGEQRLLVKGTFNVATASPEIDPSLHGVHLYVSDQQGVLFDVSLPPTPTCGVGDGWVTAGTAPNRIWKYRNRSGALPPTCAPGSARGISSVQIKDLRASTKQALQFKAKAKAATLLGELSTPINRIQVSLALAAQPSPGTASQQAKIGQCAEAVLTGNPLPLKGKPSCKPKNKNGLLDGATCKGL